MFKKLLVATAVLAASTSVALASAVPYVGASIGVKNTVGGRFMPFSIAVGYGGIVSPGFYFAGEMDADIASLNVGNSNMYKTTYGLGVSAIPGVLLSDRTMLYGRGGVVRSRFSSQNTLSTGGELGVGLQTNVNPSWDLRMEYDYITYKNVANLGTSPKSDQFKIGMVYKFE